MLTTFPTKIEAGDRGDGRLTPNLTPYPRRIASSFDELQRRPDAAEPPSK
jgi:hypothetical protein